MNDEIVIIDQTYKYKVEKILDGGIGYVRLMTMLEFSRMPPDSDGIIISDCVGEHSKYPYRTQLAAKTIKYSNLMESFSKACKPWLGLNLQGIVPLLKLIKNGDETLALMPEYAGNLRILWQDGRYRPLELLKALSPIVACLSKVYAGYGIVHQALKPENILYCYHSQKLIFELSDWGIADVQAGLLSHSELERYKVLDDFETAPYLAPERFDNFLSGLAGDIFSLGIIFFEVITGRLPYNSERDVTNQLQSGEYYEIAKNLLGDKTDERVANLILKMITASKEKRIQNYAEILALIEAI